MSIRTILSEGLTRLPSNLKEPLKTAANTWFAIQRNTRAYEPRYLFVLAHMRSGSTLLAHILMSNPEILGHGERNLPYNSEKDLRLLTAQAHYYSLRFKLTDCYAMDQINHGNLTPNREILDHPGLYKIFLIREPKASITSMLNLFGPRWGWTIDNAVEYYIDRLQYLSEYAASMQHKKQATFLTYDDLVGNYSQSLHSVDSLLNLKTPLSPDYITQEFTGKRRGDKSDVIRSGKIQNKDRQYVDIDQPTLDRLNKAYEKCYDTLKFHRNNIT